MVVIVVVHVAFLVVDVVAVVVFDAAVFGVVVAQFDFLFR